MSKRKPGRKPHKTALRTRKQEGISGGMTTQVLDGFSGFSALDFSQKSVIQGSVDNVK